MLSKYMQSSESNNFILRSFAIVTESIFWALEIGEGIQASLTIHVITQGNNL